MAGTARPEPTGRLPPAITADRLTYRPAGADGPTPLVDLSFHLPPGETLLVSGPTGAGKSTLLRLIAGLGAHATRPELSGTLVVTFPDHPDPAPDVLPAVAPGRVGFVQQEPGDGLIGLDVVSALAFPLETLGLPAQDAMVRIGAALKTFHITQLAGRDVSGLSGGERRRVALAGVAALDPPLVLLDEPLAGLDPAGARQVLSDLHRLQHERTVVIAEHRVELVAPIADRTLHLVPGEAATGRRRVLEVPRQNDPGPNLVARGLSVSRAGKPLLKEARFVLERGVWGLLGENGTGKTTLLETLAGLHRPDAGEVTVDGVPVWNATRRSPRIGRRSERLLRQRLQVAFQDPREGFFAADVVGELAAPLVALGRSEPRAAAVRARQALQHAGLERLAGRSPLRLSGGEARLVQAIGTLLTGPRVWFLDEPTHGLDADARTVLSATIAAFAARGGLVVVATHEPSLLPDETRFLFLPGDGTLQMGDAARPGASGPRAAGYAGFERIHEEVLP